MPKNELNTNYPGTISTIMSLLANAIKALLFKNYIVISDKHNSHKGEQNLPLKKLVGVYQRDKDGFKTINFKD